MSISAFPDLYGIKTPESSDIGNSQQSFSTEIDNNLQHDTVHVHEGRIDLLSSNLLRLSEGYADSEIHVIVHFLNRNGQELAAIFEVDRFGGGRQIAPGDSAGESFPKYEGKPSSFGDSKAVADDTSPDGDQQPMLVSVVHCLCMSQEPQPFPLA